MPFLTETDYSVQIRSEILTTVKNTDALPKAELSAQAEMESYLRVRFDVANVFNKEDLERNPIVLMYLVDIVLYHLHTNISPRNIPELRGIRYEAAINWLKMVAKGDLNPDLPTLPDDNAEYLFSGGSNSKYSQHW
jgi:phage gp36-like protein